MICNIIVLAVLVLSLLYIVKVSFSELKHKPLYKISSIIAVLTVVVTIIIPNIGLIVKPLTPEILLNIIDARTNLPITDSTIIVRWNIDWAYLPGENLPQLDRLESYKTDKAGTIIIKPRFKPISIYLYPFIARKSFDVNAFIFNSQYQSKLISLDIGNDNSIVRMEKITNYEDCMINVEHIKSDRYVFNVNKYIVNAVNDIVNESNNYCKSTFANGR